MCDNKQLQLIDSNYCAHMIRLRYIQLLLTHIQTHTLPSLIIITNSSHTVTYIHNIKDMYLGKHSIQIYGIINDEVVAL